MKNKLTFVRKMSCLITAGLLLAGTCFAAENEKVKDDPAFKAIEDQRPYAHPQCTTVSGLYWYCGIGNLGRDIYKAKGNMDDATLQSKLKACEDKCSAGKFDRQM